MNAISRLIVLVAIAGLFLWLFVEAIFGGGMFAFRDAAHFYYPLFKFVQGEWAAGRVPLWNPYENLGQPLAADATSSVFYPGKLIFVLPLSYAWAYKLYIMGHLLLAAATAYILARRWRASVEAAGVCALSFAFSGHVLFNYCNVVYLVGAAWLPIALLTAERMLVKRSPRWAVAFGVVLALMVLGGDPQMAYNAALLAVLYAAFLWRRESRLRANSGPLSLWERLHISPLSLWERVRVRARGETGSPMFAARKPGRSATSAATSATHDEHPAIHPHPSPLPEGEGTEFDPRPNPLPKGEGTEADPQPNPLPKGEGSESGPHHTHLPKGDGTRIRPRRKPRLLLLVIAAATVLLLAAIQILPSLEFTHYSNRLPGSCADRLLGRLEPESQLDYVYRFSVGPWRLAEYLWPNIGGRQFPVNRRWLDVLPAEGHPWTPSLYMGLLPLLLAVSAIRLRRARPREIWLSWSVLLAVAASFGWYGLGWLWHEVRIAAAAADAWPVGPPWGGLYWLLTVLLPGYVYFRYPAKLLVVAALGLSVLSARGWDRAWAGPSQRLRRWLLWLGGVSLCGAAAALLIRPLWPVWLAGAEPDKLFGPLDAAGAYHDLVTALGQTAALCGLFWCLLQKRGQNCFFRVSRMSRGAWPLGKNSSDPFSALALLLVAADLAVANGWMIVCAPARLWEKPSAAAAAIEHAEKGERVFPCRVYRHPPWTPPAWQAASSATRLAEAVEWDRDTLWPKYNLPPRIALADVPGAMMLRDYEQYLAAAGEPHQASRAVGAEYVVLPGNQTLPGGERMELAAADASLWRDPRPTPRVWITRTATALTLTLSQRERELDVITLSQRERGLDEWCRVSYYNPLRVEIEATLNRPGMVVLADQFYPGWQLEVETKGGGKRPLPIVRANQVMRGAWLPAGEHRLVYRYRPASFFWGALLSVVGWMGLAAWGAVWSIRGKGVESREKGNWLRRPDDANATITVCRDGACPLFPPT